MSFLVDGSVDLLGRASRIVGQGVSLEPPENGSGATRASGSARSFAGRDQAGDRLAPIGDNHLISRLGGSDQLRQPVFGLENVDLQSIVSRSLIANQARIDSHFGQVLLADVGSPDMSRVWPLIVDFQTARSGNSGTRPAVPLRHQPPDGGLSA
jgi:hypothetical protein